MTTGTTTTSIQHPNFHLLRRDCRAVGALPRLATTVGYGCSSTPQTRNAVAGAEWPDAAGPWLLYLRQRHWTPVAALGAVRADPGRDSRAAVVRSDASSALPAGGGALVDGGWPRPIQLFQLSGGWMTGLQFFLADSSSARTLIFADSPGRHRHLQPSSFPDPHLRRRQRGGVSVCIRLTQPGVFVRSRRVHPGEIVKEVGQLQSPSPPGPDHSDRTWWSGTSRQRRAPPDRTVINHEPLLINRGSVAPAEATQREPLPRLRLRETHTDIARYGGANEATRRAVRHPRHSGRARPAYWPWRSRRFRPWAAGGEVEPHPSSVLGPARARRVHRGRRAAAPSASPGAPEGRGRGGGGRRAGRDSTALNLVKATPPGDRVLLLDRDFPAQAVRGCGLGEGAPAHGLDFVPPVAVRECGCATGGRAPSRGDRSSDCQECSTPSRGGARGRRRPSEALMALAARRFRRAALARDSAGWVVAADSS